MKKLYMVILSFTVSVSSFCASNLNEQLQSSLVTRPADMEKGEQGATSQQQQRAQKAGKDLIRDTSEGFKRSSLPTQACVNDGDVAVASDEDERGEFQPDDKLYRRQRTEVALVAVPHAKNDDGPRSPFERRGYYPCTYRTSSDDEDYAVPPLAFSNGKDGDGEDENDSEDEDGSKRGEALIDKRFAAAFAAEKVRAFKSRRARQKAGVVSQR